MKVSKEMTSKRGTSFVDKHKYFINSLGSLDPAGKWCAKEKQGLSTKLI